MSVVRRRCSAACGNNILMAPKPSAKSSGAKPAATKPGKRAQQQPSDSAAPTKRSRRGASTPAQGSVQAGEEEERASETSEQGQAPQEVVAQSPVGSAAASPSRSRRPRNKAGATPPSEQPAVQPNQAPRRGDRSRESTPKAAAQEPRGSGTKKPRPQAVVPAVAPEDARLEEVPEEVVEEEAASSSQAGSNAEEGEEEGEEGGEEGEGEGDPVDLVSEEEEEEAEAEAEPEAEGEDVPDAEHVPVPEPEPEVVEYGDELDHGDVFHGDDENVRVGWRRLRPVGILISPCAIVAAVRRRKRGGRYGGHKAGWHGDPAARGVCQGTEGVPVCDTIAKRSASNWQSLPGILDRARVRGRRNRAGGRRRRRSADRGEK